MATPVTKFELGFGHDVEPWFQFVDKDAMFSKQYPLQSNPDMTYDKLKSVLFGDDPIVAIHIAKTMMH